MFRIPIWLLMIALLAATEVTGADATPDGEGDGRPMQRFVLSTQSKYPSVDLREYTLVTDDLERDQADAEAVVQAKIELPRAMHTKKREDFERALGRGFVFWGGEDELFDRESYIRNRVEDPSRVKSAVYRDVVVQFVADRALVTYSNVVEDEPGGPGAWKADMSWADLLVKEDGAWKYEVVHLIAFEDMTTEPAGASVGTAADGPALASSSRQDLDFFAGRWTLEGMEDTFLETCEWQPLGSYLTCRSEDRSEDPPTASLSLLGYSATEKYFTHTGFGSSPRVLRGWRRDGDGVWVFVGQRESGPDITRWQVTITPTEEGFHFRQEASKNGGPWATSAEVRYRRLL